MIDRVWEKARIIEGLNPDMFRKDACGALIMRDKYGKKNPFGWEINHIFPKSRGGGDEIDNLRAFHYQNNISKADDYPSYTSMIKYNGVDNVEESQNLTVNQRTRKKLKSLYPDA